MDARALAALAGALEDAMALEDAQQFFNDPVNVKALRLHDYHDVVARPMCLSEIAERVASAREGPPASAPEGSDAPAPYPSLVAALEDVRLVWRNCKLYNKRQRAAPVRAAADAVAAAFEASLERRLGAPPPRLPMPREARRCPGAFEPEMEEMDVPEAFGAYLPGEDLPFRMLDGFAVVRVMTAVVTLPSILHFFSKIMLKSQKR